MNNSPATRSAFAMICASVNWTVLRAERISAGFQRIVLGGEALDGLHRAALTITANSSFLNLMLTLCRQR